MKNGTIPPPFKIETRSIKHTFTLEEREQLGADLARSLAALRGIEADFDKVKADFKAKTAAAEAQVDGIGTKISNRFEMRDKRCRVVMKPDVGQKLYFLDDDSDEIPEGLEPVLVEDMTPADYQAELLMAESKFEHRTEIPLFNPTETDNGTLVVGKFEKRWYSAIRVVIGKHKIEERLDSEQTCTKKRPDAVKRAVKSFNEWLVANLGKDVAKGFQNGNDEIIKANKEREE